MRRGLLCRRRRASSSSRPACCFQVSDQLGAVLLALVRLPEAVDFQAHVVQAQLLPQRVRQQDDFRIHVGPGKTQRFGADLVELPVATALRPLVPEHRAHVVQALAAVVQQRMFGHRAHHAGGAFGAQRQLFAVQAVLEGVHLLFDDVGHLAQAANEQRRRLDDRCADVAVGVARHQAAHLVFQPLPARRLGRQDVVHAFDGSQFLSHASLFFGQALIRRRPACAEALFNVVFDDLVELIGDVVAAQRQGLLRRR